MRCLIFATVMLFAPFVWANEVMNTISPAELKVHLAQRGYKVFSHEDEEDRPQLLISMTGEEAGDTVEERKGFAMRMLGCVPQETVFFDRRCDGYEFRAYLTPGFPIKDKVYADWNRQAGGTRAFVKEGHPRLAWRVSLKGGVTWDHVYATIGIWREELAGYLDHLDSSILD